MKIQYINVGVYGVIIVLFYFINSMIPIMSDDILYSYIFPETVSDDTPWGVDVSKPIMCFNDIIQSQYNHYFHHGGRTPVHILVQAFSSLWGKDLYNILTAIVFGLFVYVLGKVCNDSKKRVSYVQFIPISILYPLILHPKCFYSTMACGINYLWSSLICITFWYLLQKKVKGVVFFILMSLLSFFAGWSHEGIVIPFCVAVSAFAYVHRNDLTSIQVLSILLFFAGAALLILAPGNFERSGNMHISIKSVFKFLLLLRVFYLYAIALFIAYKKNGPVLMEHLKQNYHLLIGLFVGLLFFAYIGPTAPRVGYGIDFMSTILLVKLLSIALDEKIFKVLGKISCVLTVVVLSVVCFLQKQAGVQICEVEDRIKTSVSDEVIITEKSVTPQPFRYFVQQYSIKESPDWNASVWGLKYHKIVKVEIHE